MVSNLRLKDTLDHLYETYGPDAIGSDPIELLSPYPDPADREVAAWIVSAFAYGRVALIREHAGTLLSWLGPHPAQTVREPIAAADIAFFRHRFHGPEDAALLLGVIRRVLARDGSVRRFFESRFRSGDSTIGPMLDSAVGEILADIGPTTVAQRFLFPRPDEGSACKRWCMLLRWMVRRDAVDFGLWPGIPRSALVVPLDTHLHRVTRRLGLTRRRATGWKTALEVTSRLRRLDAADPVKYDFALCRLGILEICRTEPRLSQCSTCGARPVCKVASRRARRAVAAPKSRRSRAEGPRPKADEGGRRPAA